MKKVININIQGIVFSIEEEAFSILSSYTDDLKNHFKNDPNGQEIISDIESSIAEKFSQKSKKWEKETVIITESDVQDVISKLGTVEQFSNDEVFSNTEKEEHKNEKSRPEREAQKRKLFRDSEDKIIGGVASGVARYFDVDPIIARAFFFVTTIFGGLGFWLYIFLWIAVPEAKSSSQKLAAEGIPADIHSIKKEVKKNLTNIKSSFSEEKENLKEKKNEIKKDLKSFQQNFSQKTKEIKVEKKFSNFFSELSEIIRNFVNIFKKNIWPFFRIIFGSIFLITSSIVLFASSILFFGFLSNDIQVTADPIASDFIQEFQNKENLKFYLGSLLAVIAIPILSIFFSSLSLIFNRKFSNIYFSTLLFIVWILSFGYFIVNTLPHADFFYQLEEKYDQDTDWDSYRENRQRQYRLHKREKRFLENKDSDDFKINQDLENINIQI